MTLRNYRRHGQEGFTLIELLIVVAIIGIIAAILIPNLLDALQKAKQKATVADIRNIGTAWYSWMTDQSSASAAGQTVTLGVLDWANDFSGSCTPVQLAEILEGGAPGAAISQFYLQKMPTEDGWEWPLEFDAVVTCGSPSTYSLLITAVRALGIRSLGRDGMQDSNGGVYPSGQFPVTAYDDDIVWSDGYFVRSPGGVNPS